MARHAASRRNGTYGNKRYGARHAISKHVGVTNTKRHEAVATHGSKRNSVRNATRKQGCLSSTNPHMARYAASKREGTNGRMRDSVRHSPSKHRGINDTKRPESIHRSRRHSVRYATRKPVLGINSTKPHVVRPATTKRYGMLRSKLHSVGYAGNVRRTNVTQRAHPSYYRSMYMRMQATTSNALVNVSRNVSSVGSVTHNRLRRRIQVMSYGSRSSTKRLRIFIRSASIRA